MPRLLELAALFIRLGTIGFGGPAAHIAMMEDEVVRKRSWVTRETFLSHVGLTNIIPGPNSTEMAMQIGYLRAGWPGLLAAGVSFILPATILTGVIAWLYVQYGALPSIEPFLKGTQPAVLAIIAAAAYRFGRTTFKGAIVWTVGVSVLFASLAGINEIVCLAMGGFVGAIWKTRNADIEWGNGSFLASVLSTPTLAAAGASGVSLIGLGLVFLKVGALLYGSGYVLIAFLQGEFVDARGWLTQHQLMDAIAVGQFTPGPVLSTATFVGYQILGVPGAIVATTAIFLPSFAYVALLQPVLQRLQQSPFFSAFIEAVTAASVSLIFAVTIRLSVATFTSWQSGAIAVLALVSIIRFKVDSAWIVLAGAAAGMLLY